MKTLFIHSKYTGKVDFDKIELDKLPGKVGLVTTTQFLDSIKEIKQHLERNNKSVLVGKGTQKNPGQLLGCDVNSAVKIKDDVDAYLYIGSGEFHPIGVALSTEKEVFTFNPVTSTFSKLNEEEINNYKRNKKIKYTKFLSAENIGILVSTKSGQNSYKKSLEIKEKLEKKGKKYFIFVFDALDTSEMENFPFIDFWVNTACPRIADDKDKKNVIDMSELDL